MIVTATAAESGATVQVQNQLVVSGMPTQPIPIRSAKMIITIDVSASDGTTHKSYTIVVQLMGWQLNETNTGLAGAGIDKNSLPVYDGALEGSYHKPAYGEVISLKKIIHPLWLINGNITLDRCWIQPISGLPESLISTYDFNDGWTPSQYSSTIIDCDIDGTAMDVQDVARECALRGLATMERNNIFGMGTGIAIFSYALIADCLIENNYVHDA